MIKLVYKRIYFGVAFKYRIDISLHVSAVHDIKSLRNIIRHGNASLFQIHVISASSVMGRALTYAARVHHDHFLPRRPCDGLKRSVTYADVNRWHKVDRRNDTNRGRHWQRGLDPPSSEFETRSADEVTAFASSDRASVDEWEARGACSSMLYSLFRAYVFSSLLHVKRGITHFFEKEH